MTTRPCLGLPGHPCGRLTRNGSRCPSCQTAFDRMLDQRRGSKQERGYDADHDAHRRRLLDEAGERGGWATCPLCQRDIDTQLPGTHPAGPQLHHIAGKAAGNHAGNYALAHALCNQQAGDPMIRSVRHGDE